jgi:prepilin-type N-terminal cleavage/methylation domain-containing protein
MSRRSEQGFTIVEILMAVVVLSIGVMALVGSSAMATRMIGRGKESTDVVQVATARAEWLRYNAAATAPGCANANIKTDSATTVTKTTPGGIGEKWVLQGNPGDLTRDVRMTFTYRVPKGTRTDTMMITLYCK